MIDVSRVIRVWPIFPPDFHSQQIHKKIKGRKTRYFTAMTAPEYINPSSTPFLPLE